MQLVQCRSATVCFPVVIVRSSCFPGQVLTTLSKRYARPLREWKDCAAGGAGQPRWRPGLCPAHRRCAHVHDCRPRDGGTSCVRPALSRPTARPRLCSAAGRAPLQGRCAAVQRRVCQRPGACLGDEGRCQRKVAATAPALVVPLVQDLQVQPAPARGREQTVMRPSRSPAPCEAAGCHQHPSARPDQRSPAHATAPAKALAQISTVRAQLSSGEAAVSPCCQAGQAECARASPSQLSCCACF